MVAYVDQGQVEEVVRCVAMLDDVVPYDFANPAFGEGLFPEPGSPLALDYFFAVTLHQYGFWSDDGAGYAEPYYGLLDGISRKGAEFMFRAYMKKAEADPGFLTPERQASLSREELEDVLATDDGPCVLPMFDTHLELARAYGFDMLSQGLSPEKIVDISNSRQDPFRTFVEFCERIGGYQEDPLRKKTSLLAIILKNRPEAFLNIENSDLVPVVDYHIQRTFLRTGMVEIEDLDLRRKVAARRFLQTNEEDALRRTVYEAVELLEVLSGKDVAAIDWFFFSFRKLCHEMTDPACERCPVAAVCKRYVELFQPVFRTTFY